MTKVLSPGRLMLVVSTAVTSAASSAVTAVTAFSTSPPSLSLFFFCSSSSSVRGESSTASGLIEAVGLKSGFTDAAVAAVVVVVALSDVVVWDGVVVSECSDSDMGGFKIFLSLLCLR